MLPKYVIEKIYTGPYTNEQLRQAEQEYKRRNPKKPYVSSFLTTVKPEEKGNSETAAAGDASGGGS